MKANFRALVGVIAAFMLVNGLGFWFALDQIAPSYALSVDNPLARSGIRADFGGFFLTVFMLASVAAAKMDATAARTAAGMFGLALAGRLLTLMFDGAVPTSMLPMIVEATSATVLLLAAHVWSHETSTALDTHAVVKI